DPPADTSTGSASGVAPSPPATRPEEAATTTTSAAHPHQPGAPAEDAPTVVTPRAGAPRPDDATAVIPQVRTGDETSLLGVIPPAPPPDPEPPAPPEPRRPGERVILLRAVRTHTGGYASIHSALTRTTVGSVLRAAFR